MHLHGFLPVQVVVLVQLVQESWYILLNIFRCTYDHHILIISYVCWNKYKRKLLVVPLNASEFIRIHVSLDCSTPSMTYD